ncbi:uncharacterized protein TNCV_5112961 [Trichonephila clavipes]|nr:uncharacterized protein TNCV_5112961 [Trichonephila clavipes]
MNGRDVRRSESFMGISAPLKKKVSEGSISSEKLERGLSDTLFNVDSETLSGNKIFDIEILMSIFSILSCPVCYNQELCLIEDLRLGFQSNLCLKYNMKLSCCMLRHKLQTILRWSQQNHKGSASNMETVGAYRIFERSEANRSLRYKSYYGDGDSKALNNVKDIYGYDSVVKYECIGHVQKRVGSRLRKLKKSTKG